MPLATHEETMVRLDQTINGPDGLANSVRELRKTVEDLRLFRSQIIGACAFCGVVAPIIWHFLLK